MEVPSLQARGNYMDSPDAVFTHVPPTLEDPPVENPFPSRALQVYKYHRPRNTGTPQPHIHMINILDPLQRFGSQLRVLNLDGLSIRISVLVGILEKTPNLEALLLSHFAVCDSDTCFTTSLPPLPHLQTLMMKQVNAAVVADSIELLINHTTNWFIDPYISQLDKLEVNAFTVTLDFPLPHLHQLAIFNVMQTRSFQHTAVELENLAVHIDWICSAINIH